MATSFNFGGVKITIPGSYSQIVSGVQNPPVTNDYGTVLIIDTGTGATFGGGAGASSDLESGVPTYTFNDIDEMRNSIEGGLWWLLAKPLFFPLGVGAPGVSSVIFAKAATTVSAKYTYTFTGDNDGSSSVTNGGTVQIAVRNEGIIGNGELNSSSVLAKGYGVIMKASTLDPTKYVLEFRKGRFKGLDTNGNPYDNKAKNDLKLFDILVTSDPFSTVTELVAWMSTNFTFKSYFKLVSSTTDGDASVDSADLDDNDTLALFTGGTEVYDTTLVQSILDKHAKDNISFVISDNFGTSAAQSTLNENTYLPFCVTQSKYKPELYIAAGDDQDELAFSRATCAVFDNDTVTVTHGDAKINTQLGTRTYSSIYSCCAILGREAGLEPQVPITYKEIDIDGTTYPLNDKDVTLGLNAGLVMFRNEFGTFDIVKGVNTLQNNQFLVNEDNTISSKQIKRITRQVNKQLIINSYTRLLKDPNGVNRTSSSPEDVRSFTKKELRAVSPSGGGALILSFSNITISRDQDAYSVKYELEPNSEISLLLFTGTIIGI